MAVRGQGRRHLAEEVAKCMWEGGIQDFRLAKEKAARKLGMTQHGLPDNLEIAAALRSYGRIFGGPMLEAHRAGLLATAKQAMSLCATCDPLLVGALVDNLITPHTGVELQAFSEHPEAVGLALQAQGIAHEWNEKRLRLSDSEYQAFPAFDFELDGVGVRVLVLPLKLQRQAPRSPVDGRPMRRLTWEQAKALL